ncbi:6890_t:CDS:2 [Funneliformis caledonium]|uniref:6890_t:CDS:1 n=1 Tax=Funneliformis caledonium TaxID=1117310 RepID=A0A9N9EX31_9GLOM|nr:6890_t:CDS:2 [Funneliformis caledonium]
MNRLKRLKQRICELLDQQNLALNKSIIELKLNTDTNNKQNTIKNIISQNILSDDSNIEVIDLTSLDTAFDDDIYYKDASENEPITKQPKYKKFNINILQNCINLKNCIKAALYQSMNYY